VLRAYTFAGKRTPRTSETRTMADPANDARRSFAAERVREHERDPNNGLARRSPGRVVRGVRLPANVYARNTSEQ
jgi:hypothetical protein